ncbi:hypothetical protein ACGRPC_18420 [Vibrio diabolicus]|uniref:hypothetical protein n=1 Tax=Vibrio diabolicus TaxID=50719 RepID=UPI0024947A73|nr:hypothetical protein [Vibrio diabolicus]
MRKFQYGMKVSDCESELNFVAYSGDKLCQLIELDSVIAKRRSSIELIIQDVIECHNILDQIPAVEDSPLSGYLYKAFAITYRKCFSTGNVRGLSLDAKSVFKGKAELKKQHNSVIDIRNTYIAHADNGMCEQAIVYLASNGDDHEVFVPSNKYLMPVGLSLTSLTGLTEHLHSYLLSQVQKLDIKLLQENA